MQLGNSLRMKMLAQWTPSLGTSISSYISESVKYRNEAERLEREDKALTVNREIRAKLSEIKYFQVAMSKSKTSVAVESNKQKITTLEKEVEILKNRL